jgi:transcriptional regulator with XRE-family HTH domain
MSPLLDQPALGRALAWLRARMRLTQREVVERVQRRGETLSEVYYQALETGKRRPRLPKLDAILAALGSDRAELEGLLASAPWRHTPPTRARIRADTPKPAVYLAAAEDALAGGVWSSEVELGTLSDVRGRGELAELVDHYVNLPPADRELLLEQARRRRWQR